MFCLVFSFLLVVEIFKLAMAMSLNTLKKLTKKELTNIVLEYQNKFDNMLSNINTKFISLMTDLRKWNLVF